MLPMLPMLPVASSNTQCRLGIGKIGNWHHFHIGNILKNALCGLLMPLVAEAEAEPFNHSTIQPFNSYTNHAGNVVSGVVVALDLSTATISNDMETVALPLSIFPEPEQRRIAADFVLGADGVGQIDLLRVPVEVKRAVSGAEKAMARSRKRAEKGLCTQEESDAFCAESDAALRSYLEKQVNEGVITPAERKALMRGKML